MIHSAATYFIMNLIYVVVLYHSFSMLFLECLWLLKGFNSNFLFYFYNDSVWIVLIFLCSCLFRLRLPYGFDLDCKEIKPVDPKGNQSWILIGRTDAEAETPMFWPLDVKNWLTGKDPDAGKDWRQEEKGTTEDKVVGWLHWLDGHEFEQSLGVGDGQGSLACYSPWGRKESDTTEWLNRTELPYGRRARNVGVSVAFFIQEHYNTIAHWIPLSKGSIHVPCCLTMGTRQPLKRECWTPPQLPLCWKSRAFRSPFYLQSWMSCHVTGNGEWHPKCHWKDWVSHPGVRMS